ncbi:MAG: hypothetical protein NBV60_09730 [Erythrobacter sp.]|nr:hypothetical protein [Erythrobacter sp.]
MEKRSAYLAGVVVGANALIAQYVFNLGLGPFIWPLAVMTLVFAVAFIVTPADGREPGD